MVLRIASGTGHFEEENMPNACVEGQRPGSHISTLQTLSDLSANCTLVAAFVGMRLRTARFSHVSQIERRRICFSRLCVRQLMHSLSGQRPSPIVSVMGSTGGTNVRGNMRVHSETGWATDDLYLPFKRWFHARSLPRPHSSALAKDLIS